MSEIEMEEYIRTKEGFIGKIVDIDKKNFKEWGYFIDNRYLQEEQKGFPIASCRILKRSNDIKELIKEGDILRYKLKGLGNKYITIVKKYHDARSNQNRLVINGYGLDQVEILGIIALERYEKEEYKVEN